MKKYEYIVFDFNGTIINDILLCLNILNYMLSKRDYKTVSLEEYREIFGFPIREYYMKAGIDLNKHDFKMLSEEFIKMYQLESLKCDLFDRCIELLEYLNKKGYKLILLSLSQIDNLLQQTNSFGITKYFIKVLGLDNILAHSKAELAKEYFSVNNIDINKVLFIGDTFHDYEVAKLVNADVILTSSGHQSYNRLKTSKVRVIKEIKDLFDIL